MSQTKQRSDWRLVEQRVKNQLNELGPGSVLHSCSWPALTIGAVFDVSTLTHTCLSQPQIMLPTDSPMPLYPSIMFASSLEAAATEMRRLFLSR